MPDILGSGASGPFRQGRAAGGARFDRLEGAWHRDGRLWFTDTAGGDAGCGVLWSLQDDAGDGRLTALLVAAAESEADHLDNVTVSPRGGVLMCEDGGGRGPGHTPDGGLGSRLIGVDARGGAFAFAENAGRCWSMYRPRA